MSTHRLLNLTVLAEISLMGLTDLAAYAADPAPVTASSKAAAPPPKTNLAAPRPLAAKDVWGHDYAEARKRAKTLNRPVLLHFHATWCGPCEHMERTVLNTGDVLKEINSRCVAVKVDSDKHPNLVEQFGIDALPCDVFVSPDGKILMVNPGALSANEYRALIATVAPAKSAAPAEVKLATN